MESGDIDKPYQLLTLPAPIGARVLDCSRTFLFHSSLPGEQLGYRIKVPVVRTFTVTNQPKLSRSHTNSTDLTSRLPDGRSTSDHRKIAAYEQTLKRSAPRAPVLYHRPIGRCFTRSFGKVMRKSTDSSATHAIKKALLINSNIAYDVKKMMIPGRIKKAMNR